MVEFLDLHHQYISIKKDIDDAIKSVIDDTSFIGGKYVSKFESEFADYNNVDHCIGVANGTDALEIAIESLSLPRGSEIIVPANSFIASAEAVSRSGCKIVFCDVNHDDYTINLESLKNNISSNTAAIIAVHLYGHPCDMDGINGLAKQFNLKIIEDCAQAHGAEYKDIKVGSLGDIACFSFYPGKNLGAYGDAGAIVTNNEELALFCRMFANHGRAEKYSHNFEGRNSRLDAMQASILSAKLKHLDIWTQYRIDVASVYIEKLCDIHDISLPKTKKMVKHVYHLFVIRYERRDELIRHLNKNNISTGVHYPIALPKQLAFSYLNQNCDDYFACQSDSLLISLPIGDHVKEQHINLVVDTVKNFVC